MRSRSRSTRRRATDHGRGALVALPFLLLATGCADVLDDLLEAELPGTVLDETLHDPMNADLLVTSVATDFECAFANYIMAGGLVGNEVTWGDNNTFDYDRRSWTSEGGVYASGDCATAIGSTAGLAVYQPLSTARWSADNAHEILSGFSDADVADRGVKLARVSAYGAYATLLLGEAMCQAAIDVGPALSRRDIWELAERRFTTALSEAEAADATDIVNFALVGRARTRINLATNPEEPVAAKAVEAAADARRVPEGFVYFAQYAGVDNRSSNMPFWWINEQIRSSIEADYWNLDYNGVPDTRVELDHTGRLAMDGNTPLVLQTKYLSRSASIAIARWAEAQLIVAEVEGGQAAVDVISELHDRAGLPSFSSTDAADIRAHVIQERQRELFLESHHLNDMIRFDLPFTPAPGMPYKLTGGGTYGDMECFPLPDIERFNNPNID